MLFVLCYTHIILVGFSHSCGSDFLMTTVEVGCVASEDTVIACLLMKAPLILCDCDNGQEIYLQQTC
jgi:hypothetical protein